MDTRKRGDIAEAAALRAFTECGLSVWLPWSPFGACDRHVENSAGTIVRAQIKSGRVRSGCVLANSRSTDHGSGRQSYVGHVDILAVHAPEIDEQFVIPIAEACGFDIRLRLSPTRNNQRLRVKYAHDYRLRDWADRFGNTAAPTGITTIAA